MERQWPRCNDRLMLVACFPDVREASGALSEKVVYELNGAKRSSGEHVMTLPADLVEQKIEVYLAFISEDGKQASRSQYFHIGLV